MAFAMRLSAPKAASSAVRVNPVQVTASPGPAAVYPARASPPSCRSAFDGSERTLLDECIARQGRSPGGPRAARRGRHVNPTIPRAQARRCAGPVRALATPAEADMYQEF